MKRNEYIVSAKRSGTVTLSTEPSDLTMCLSPFLTEFERRFLVDNMVLKSIEFSGAANAQIFCRCMMHDISKPSENQTLPSSVKRGSETVLFIHGFHKMITSWTWIKYATTIYREGFNVILMDLPGFGRSSVGRDVRCPVEAWRSWEVQIFTTFLSELGVNCVNVVGCYESASVFMSVLLHAPQVLSRNHYLHNPLFSDDQLRNPRISGVLKALLSGGIKRRVFCTFDRNRYPDPLSRGDSSLTEAMVEDLLASEQMMKAIAKTVGFNQVTISPITSSDLAEICWYEAQDQPGVSPIFALYPTKRFRLYIAQYLAGGDVSVFVPTEEARDAPSKPSTIPSGGGLPKPQSALTDREPVNAYSYGVRIRRLEEERELEMALKQSEREYLEEFGEERLLNQQALADGLADRMKES